MNRNYFKLLAIIIIAILSIFLLIYKAISFNNNSPFKLDDPKDVVLNSYREGYLMFKDSNYGASFQYPSDFKIKALSKSVLAVYLEPEDPQAEPTSYVYISKTIKNSRSDIGLADVDFKLENIGADEEEIVLPYTSAEPTPSTEISKIFQEGNLIFNVKGSYTIQEKTETQIKEIIESFSVL